MSTQGPTDSLQEILSNSQQMIIEIDRLRQEIVSIRTSASPEFTREISGMKSEVVSTKNLAMELQAGQQSLLAQSSQVLIDIVSLPQKPHIVDPSVFQTASIGTKIRK